jgi:uncharacterized protein YndB with AHSA1/START domain
MTRGGLHEVDGRWRLEFVRRLPYRLDDVWRGLTDPRYLRGWFPAEIQGEREAGARLRFVFPDDPGPASHGEMVTYDPPSVLEFRWDVDLLRFELSPEGDSTVLTFSDTFEELGKAAREGAGWHACLDLFEYELADDDPPWNPAERWEQLHDSYVEQLGPEASTVGPPELT